MNRNQHGGEKSMSVQEKKDVSHGVDRRKKHNTGRYASYYLACFVMFLIFVAIILAALAFCLMVSMNVSSTPQYITYVIESRSESGTENEAVMKTEKHVLDSVCSGNTFFIGIADVAKLYDFVYIGDYNEYSLTCKENGEYITFYRDSIKFTVNGMECRMSSASFESDGQLYVPCEVFAQSLSGFSAVYDSEKLSLNIIRNLDTSRIEFSVKSLDPILPIGEIDYQENTGDTSDSDDTGDSDEGKTE